ncbi:CCA tRNA nucleotidyltransferase, mitochondrial-like isoform X2 [Phragmites australis]|uniref:CCA tRNA nucleotidyltransferase, mitochondrial-like isoform X2 n=1 Tax=Phragmites australis TaxID=29695 RepID=UPI002D76858A|nr:CCA tRNA nucleotidyltransferase, mitochondrial-like isoform X2 [Phragmites australis]
MPHRLLLPRGGGLLLPPLRRRSPASSPPLRSVAPHALHRNFFFSRIRAFSGNHGMAAVSPEQQQRRSVEVSETVELTEKEERIFRRLLDVVRHFDLGTQLRVAGGWVRDKLLGKDSADIDIALDNMTGRNFCEKVNEYSELIGEEQKGIGVIQCNPDQSKHLETARMLIFDIWIDFVNLRSEKYAENSRIPTMEIGTAKEDAYRRDLTINSLFFNINNKSVEDLTGRGIDDLKKGLIVTPLPAKATFLDDPLRVLRAIRFAARFDFTLAEDLKEAASDEKVKSELGSKISRERIGHEIDLMMLDKRPVKAMCYIRDLGLFYVVFAFPDKSDPPVFDKCDWHCVSYIEAAWNLAYLTGCSVFSGGSDPKLQDEQRRLCLYSALFIPLRNIFYLDKKSKEVPVTSYIIRDSLKLKGSDAETVVNIHAASEKFAELVLLSESDVDMGTLKEKLEDEYLEIPTDLVKRVFAGLLLREIKDFWRVALLISILSYPEAENVGDILSQQDELHRRKEKYIRAERSITDLDLDGVWKLKPLLDGKTIMGVMQVKGGPLIGKWQQRLVKWQLAHPRGTADECIEWMKQSQSKRQKVESSA